jgi:hypothetical protein
MTIKNRTARFAQIFALFSLIAVFAAAAFPSATLASGRAPKMPPSSLGKVTVFVFDQASGKTIGGAAVTFRSPNSVVIIAKGLTDNNGAVTVALDEGLYAVDVSATNLKPASDLVKSVAGTGLDYKVALTPNITISATPPPTY